MQQTLNHATLAWADQDRASGLQQYLRFALGNGIYAVEYEGRRLIRRIEQRLGDRIVLKCDNPAYRDCELSAAFTRDGRLRILGKVHAVIGLRLL